MPTSDILNDRPQVENNNSTETKQPNAAKQEKKTEELTKASEKTSAAAAEAIEKFNATQKQIDALEIKKGLEKGKRSARRMAEAEQLGFVDELTKLRAQNARSRCNGLDFIEQKIDGELGESEQFDAIISGANDEDPLESINELIANSPAIETNDIFKLLGS
jgi:hypothetical protein